MEGRTLTEIDEAALTSAVEAEAAYPRNFLPPEPFWPAITQHKAQFTTAVQRDLERGRVWSPGHVVDVRKPGHGVRPIAILAPEARVLYRALADVCAPDPMRPDRTSEAYAAFLVAPIKSGFSQLPQGPTKIGDSRFGYIAISDIAAFFQYVDHELLRSELDLNGAPIHSVDALLELLAELHQRNFGLPQRSEPSDWLAEIYAIRIDRWLARSGLEHWRYNDDFRIGCETYTDALHAIEVLSAAARDSGLVLNDEKTVAPRFFTYLVNYSNVDVHAASDDIDPADVEASVLTIEYAPEDDEQVREDALEVIDQLFVSGQSTSSHHKPIDLTDLSHDDHRSIRRAINTLARLGDDHALPILLDLLAYQPAMTHLIVRYAERIAATAPGVADVLDQTIAKLSLTDWQRAWVAYGYRACAAGIHGAREQWLRTLLGQEPSSYSAAEAAVTMSGAGLLDFSMVEDRIRRAPTALVPWYLVAAANLKTQGAVSQSAVGALQAVSPTARALLS